MSFQNILQKYRSIAFSKRDLGTRFERLMQAYLQTDPVYADKFEHVWLWMEFPYRKSFGDGKDTGIDLVARTVDGEYWAVQCKCYDDGTQISKDDVDTFLSTSGKQFATDEDEAVSFAVRLWISTTDKWSSTAEETIKGQQVPLQRVNLADLDSAAVDWAELDKGISGARARKEKKVLRPHQEKAIAAFHEHFKSAHRGKLIMACGTGKTFTSLKIAETETGGRGRVLFLAPSIALVGQTLREWAAETSTHIFPICICSDPEVSQVKEKLDEGDRDGYSVTDLAFPASTRVDDIVAQFDKAEKYYPDSMTVVFSTYQSISVISNAQQELLLRRERERRILPNLTLSYVTRRTERPVLHCQKLTSQLL